MVRTGEQSQDDSVRSTRPITRSEMSGSAGNVLQAGSISGDIHFHQVGPATTPIPRQLPSGIRGFVNRLSEFRYLDAALFSNTSTDPPSVPIAVITGTAGVGKTTFVLHWAHKVKDYFPDGQLYVNLRGYGPGEPVSPQQALERFLTALGIPPQAIPADVDASAALYRSLLAGRRMLVVLDNAATAAQVRPLLPGAPDCLVLVTSRSRLSSLVVREGAHRVTLGVLPEDDAAELFRVVTAGHRAQDDPAKLVELAHLCARLPLALRIAAERAASRSWMPLDELIADLRSESRLWDALTAEEGEGEAVRTVFSWSYRALPADTARLFRLLGLHPGAEFGVPVVAVIAGTSVADAQHQLDTLVGAHLLENHSSGRYQFHDLLRSYAADQADLEETSESRRVHLHRALDWYLRTMDAALSLLSPRDAHVPLDPPEPGLEPLQFASYQDALEWYETERPNLVAATRAAANGMLDIAWKLALTLYPVYSHFNPFDDWITTSTIGLDAARELGDREAEAALLHSLGGAYSQSHRLAKGLEYKTAALELRRELGDRMGEGLSLNGIGLIYFRSRDLVQAGSMFEGSMAVFRDLDERYWEAVVAVNLAEVRAELGRPDEAEPLVRQALEVFVERGDRTEEGSALRVLSMIVRKLGELERAEETIERALALARDQRNPMREGFRLIELGLVHLAAGNAPDALVAFQRSAQLHQEVGDRTREARAWNGIGRAYQEMGRPEEAIDYHRRAAAVYRELGNRWWHAVTLSDLAIALHLAGEVSEAEENGRNALEMLTEFDDPAARELRDRVAEVLGRAQ